MKGLAANLVHGRIEFCDRQVCQAQHRQCVLTRIGRRQAIVCGLSGPRTACVVRPTTTRSVAMRMGRVGQRIARAKTWEKAEKAHIVACLCALSSFGDYVIWQVTLVPETPRCPVGDSATEWRGPRSHKPVSARPADPLSVCAPLYGAA